MLLTTQYLDEADQMADRVAVMDKGVVVADGTPAELKDRVTGKRLDLVAAGPRSLRPPRRCPRATSAGAGPRAPYCQFADRRHRRRHLRLVRRYRSGAPVGPELRGARNDPRRSLLRPYRSLGRIVSLVGIVSLGRVVARGGPCLSPRRPSPSPSPRRAWEQGAPGRGRPWLCGALGFRAGRVDTLITSLALPVMLMLLFVTLFGGASTPRRRLRDLRRARGARLCAGFGQPIQRSGLPPTWRRDRRPVPVHGRQRRRHPGRPRRRQRGTQRLGHGPGAGGGAGDWL